MLEIDPPGQEEYATWHAGYLRLAVERGGPGRLLPVQVDRLMRLCGGLDEEAALYRYAPGKWSIKQVIGHLADSERIFSYRALRIARGDTTPLPGFEQNDYVETGGFDSRPLGELLADFEAARASTARLLTSFGPEVWLRRAEVSGSPTSVRAIAYIIVGHVEHHADLLRDRYGLREGG